VKLKENIVNKKKKRIDLLPIVVMVVIAVMVAIAVITLIVSITLLRNIVYCTD
jgi:hypothetical protein